MGILSRVSDSLELPGDILLGGFNLHILGGNIIYIENYKRIELYCSENIVIKGIKKSISIIGTELIIESYTKSEMYIRGKVKEITFE